MAKQLQKESEFLARLVMRILPKHLEQASASPDQCAVSHGSRRTSSVRGTFRFLITDT